MGPDVLDDDRLPRAARGRDLRVVSKIEHALSRVRDRVHGAALDHVPRDEDHEIESVRLAKPMLSRLQLSAEARHTVEFLIAHHIAMSRAVFRRDFTDPDTVAEFASLVGNEENLKKLCLMTFCDIEAVAPGVLTPWKEDLLWRLYVDAYNHLTLNYADELIQKDIADRSAVMAERPSDNSELELSRFLKGLPRRYLTVFGLTTIYQHVRLARGLLPGELHASLERRDDI